MGLSWSLHVTTVPFNMATEVAFTLRVDVRAEMRVAVKMPRSTGGCPTGVSLRNRTTGLNLVLLHSRLVAPPVTVHVRITSSPGHMPPRALEVSVTTPSEYQHNTIQGMYACVHECVSGWRVGAKIIAGHIPLFSNTIVV